MANQDLLSTLGFGILVGTYGFFWVSTMILFLLRRDHEPIRSRGAMGVIWQTCWGFTCFVLLAYAYWRDTCMAFYFVQVFMIPYWHWPYFLRAFVLWSRFSSQFHKLKVAAPSTSHHGEVAPVLRYKKAVKFRYTFPAYLFISSTFVFVGLVIYFAHDKHNYDPATSPMCPTTQLIFATVEAGLSALLIVFTVFFLRKVEDELFLKNELKSVTIIGIPLFIFWTVVVYTGILPREASFATIFIMIITSHIFAVCIPILLSFKITPGSIYSRLMKNSRSVELAVDYNGKRDPLLAIMENPTTGKSFEKFCAKSFCVENILFLKATWNYNQSYSVESAPEKANKIFEEFLRPGCDNEVNLDEIIRTVVTEKIHEQDYPANLFDESAQSVYNFVRFGTFELWRKSAMCKIALEDCGATNLTQLLELDVESGREASLKISIESVPM